jgi:hypothetical protein
LEHFRRQVVLSEDPFEYKVKVAKAVGAYEVYSYLLDMTEEDINNEDMH